MKSLENDIISGLPRDEIVERAWNDDPTASLEIVPKAMGLGCQVDNLRPTVGVEWPVMTTSELKDEKGA